MSTHGTFSNTGVCYYHNEIKQWLCAVHDNNIPPYILHVPDYVDNEVFTARE